MRRLILALLLAASPAAAEQPQFHAIVIDTSVMAARGVPNLAARVRAVLAPELAEQFGSRSTRGAPDIVVRIKGYQLASEAGSGERFSLESDTLDGSVDLVSGGKVVASHPLLVSLRPGYSGRYLPDNEQRRLVDLSRAFSQWARRALGG